MGKQIRLGGICVDITFKAIKNLHLSVYPPSGSVRISAPAHMNLETVRVYAISRLPWIKQQRKKMQEQARETRREYVERESHYVWGKRYLLSVEDHNGPAAITLERNKMILRVRPGSSRVKRDGIIAGWYREQIRGALTDLLLKWAPVVGVKVTGIFIQHMKTRWGGCNPAVGNIRLNTDLAKKPRECLEYILVHEMLHIRVPHHNDRFRELMAGYIPNWQAIRDELNRLPVGHEEWSY